MTQMPLSDHRCLITRGLERLGHKVLGWVHTNIVPGKDDAVSDAQAHGVTASHQCSSRGRADGGCVKAVEPDPLLRQFVERRRIDITAVVANISPSEIVCNHDHDVGLVTRGGVSRQHREQQQQVGGGFNYGVHKHRFLFFILGSYS